MEFFNNKRLLIVLSGVACIMIALVVFVVSIVGFGNIGAFFGGSSYVEPTPEPATPTPVPPTTVPAVPTPTPEYTLPPENTTPPATTPPEETPELTTPPVTETPSETVTLEPTVTPTPSIVPANSVLIKQSSPYIMAIGETVLLSADVFPRNATNQDLIWTNVTGDSVAMVGANGNVRALAAGKATIKVQVDDAVGVYATIDIIVVSVTVEETNVSLTVGDEKELQYAVTPADQANSQAITWGSSDSAVVTVANGKLTAVGAGTATIKVSVNHVVCATIQVTVSEATQEPPVENPPVDSGDGSDDTGGESQAQDGLGENP